MKELSNTIVAEAALLGRLGWRVLPLLVTSGFVSCCVSAGIESKQPPVRAEGTFQYFTRWDNVVSSCIGTADVHTLLSTFESGAGVTNPWVFFNLCRPYSRIDDAAVGMLLSVSGLSSDPLAGTIMLQRGDGIQLQLAVEGKGLWRWLKGIQLLSADNSPVAPPPIGDDDVYPIARGWLEYAYGISDVGRFGFLRLQVGKCGWLVWFEGDFVDRSGRRRMVCDVLPVSRRGNIDAQVYVDFVNSLVSEERISVEQAIATMSDVRKDVTVRTTEEIRLLAESLAMPDVARSVGVPIWAERPRKERSYIYWCWNLRGTPVRCEVATDPSGQVVSIRRMVFRASGSALELGLSGSRCLDDDRSEREGLRE